MVQGTKLGCPLNPLPHLATKLCLLICAWTKILEKGPPALDVSPIWGFFGENAPFC